MGIALQSSTPSVRYQLNGFAVSAQCRPAEEVAGDFYAIVAREPARLAVVIGDACGRGRAGAALLPEILPKVRELLRSGVDPGCLLTELNQTATRVLPLDRFITAAALELDAELCTLSVANAGHVPTLVQSPRSRVRVVGRASGPPLGIVANACYVEERVPLAEGETVVLMTDGVLEAIESNLWAMPTLQEIVRTAPPGAGAVSRAILDVLDACRNSRPADDITLVTVELEHAAADVLRGAS